MRLVFILCVAVFTNARTFAASLPDAIHSLISSGRLEDADRQLKEEISTNGESNRTRYLNAFLLFKRKEFDASLKLLDQCLVAGYDDPEVYKLIAANGLALNRPEIAERAFQSELQKSPADMTGRLHLGVLYYTTNRFAQAESEFQRIIEQHPDFMKAYDFLGLVQEELRNDEAVLASYRKAIQLVDQQGLKDEGPYLHSAKFLWLRNRFEESETFARTAVSLNPQSGEAWYVLGRLLNRLGKTNEAEKALLTAIAVDPKYPEPHYLLSLLYRKLGRSAEADRQFQLFEEIKKQEPRR